MRPDRIGMVKILGLIMHDWPGVLWMRPDRIGIVEIEPDYAGMTRTIVDEAR